MRYFDEHNDIYTRLNQGITRIPARIPELVETNQRAVIYLPESLTFLVFEYIEFAKFTYTTDGIGLRDDYAEKFFEHLFDEKIRLEMENRCNSIMSELRKAVK